MDEAEENAALHRALSDEVTAVLVQNHNLPDWMRVGALGRNMRPLGDLAAGAVLPLVIRREQRGYREAIDDILGDRVDTVRTRLASSLGKLEEVREILTELGDCDEYEGEQTCITAGPEVLKAEGCLACKVRAVVEREW